MGERLVIVNQINGYTINAIYYHWSNYTQTAVAEVLALSDVSKPIMMILTTKHRIHQSTHSIWHA